LPHLLSRGTDGQRHQTDGRNHVDFGDAEQNATGGAIMVLAETSVFALK
jgi:hypothetical protein